MAAPARSSGPAATPPPGTRRKSRPEGELEGAEKPHGVVVKLAVEVRNQLSLHEIETLLTVPGLKRCV